MKKIFVLIIAAIMVMTTLVGTFAHAALFDREPKRADEGLCAIGGALVGGVLGHQFVGKNPATALLAILGGAIGYDYCVNYVNNPRYQALKDLIRDGFGKRPGPRSFKAETNEFVAGIYILAYGTKSEVFGQRNCVNFEASVYKQDGRFMGRVQPLWACETQSGDYEIMRNNHGIYIVNLTSGSGSVGVGSGSSAGTYASVSRYWKKLDFSQMTTGTTVTDRTTGKKRPVLLMNRRGEYGFFAGRVITQDGYYGVKMATDIALVGSEQNYTSVSYEQDVAVECNELNYCQAFQVRNVKFDGAVLNGVAQYIFQNGDMIVIDSVNGNYIVPKEYL